MNVPNKVNPPNNEPFWQDFDAVLLTKVNEIIEYLESQIPRVDTTSTNQDECTHANSYQMRPGIMRCRTCKRIYKVSV